MDILATLKSRFATDALANMVSVGILGVCGLLLNFTIASRYGAQTLGIFNEVYAIFMITSQLGSMGTHSSCLKHVAQYSDDLPQRNLIVTSGLALTALSATLFSTLLYLSRGAMADLMKSPDLSVAIMLVIPGLWCFIINKLLLNILNGLRQMKAFAFFSSFRYIALIAALFVAVLIEIPSAYLTAIISVAEIALLLGLALFGLRILSLSLKKGFGEWIKQHLAFGLKSLLGGLLVEANMRVDVLMLGYFVSEYWVGIYSFASMLIEGLNQVPYVFRRNMDPILTRLIIGGQLEEVKRAVRIGKRWTRLGMLLVGVVSTAAFPLIVNKVVGNPAFNEGWLAFMILMTGSIVMAGYIPFSGILIQGGYPGLQSLFILSFCLVNVIFNALLIPWLGINGAAIATAISFMSIYFSLKIFTRRAFKIWI